MPLDAGATLAELALALGRENELRSALAEAQAARRRSAELATAIVDGDYADAAELAVATGHRALEARIRLLAAQRLAAEGRHAEAEAEARSALDFYRSVGGSRYIREAEALLRESA